MIQSLNICFFSYILFFVSNKKILIVDDDKILSLILSRKLSEAGYIPITAFDGIQAVKLAFKENPALIILDIMFPGGGGFSTLENFSSSAKTYNTPIIICTAHDDPEIREKVNQYNFADFMIKPVEPNKLIEKIKNILGD